jgi:hypothetical protein
MDSVQIIFDIIIGIAGFLCGFILYAIWNRMGHLETKDEKLADEISKIHVLVAGDYVKRVELTPQLDSIFKELRMIRAEIGENLFKRDK